MYGHPLSKIQIKISDYNIGITRAVFLSFYIFALPYPEDEKMKEEEQEDDPKKTKTNS